MLKYENEITSIGNCPRSDFKQVEHEAFRFVSQINTGEKNFLPVIKINPRRGNNFNNEKLCDAYSLSMFKTEDEAIEFYKKIKSRFPNIGKSIGDSIASCRLKKEYGLAGNYRKDGHFSFFTFEKVDLSSKFTIVNRQL